MKAKRTSVQPIVVPEPSILAEEPFYRVHYINRSGLHRRSTMFSNASWTNHTRSERAERCAAMLVASKAFYEQQGCRLLSLEVLTHSVSDL